MAKTTNSVEMRPRRRGPVRLSELVGKAIAPVIARRGFATADIVSAWPSLAGVAFARCTRPEKILWPRGDASERSPAMLVVRVDGPRAILFQHETGQIVERINAFLGYAAIGQIRIVQGPVAATKPTPAAAPRTLPPEEEARLSATVAAVDSTPLRAALERLGRGVLGEEAR